jgi:hypothetical protein
MSTSIYVASIVGFTKAVTQYTRLSIFDGRARRSAVAAGGIGVDPAIVALMRQLGRFT